MKIIVIGSFKLEPDQKKRLELLGEVSYLQDTKESKEKALTQLADFDIICSESKPIANIIYDLKDKLISFPFVGVGFLDLKKLTNNNVRVANAPGCNKAAVSEWILGMMIILSRKLLKYIGIKEIGENDFLEEMPGLAGKKVAILGKGNVGSRVGRICEAFDMQVAYFEKGDNILQSTQGADCTINCLANNQETKGLLGKEFFEALKNKSFFVSITDTEIYDVDALIDAMDSGHLAGAAIDPAGIGIFNPKGDVYKKLKNNPKILTTPHISFHTDMTERVANDIMIDNIEAWAKNKPINLVN
ncbi:MAG: NAD(P)-dependent oxidoreductase [Parcubacteria group bacterium]|jgi:phosphoglycerate dehydrogenase-like enzyme